MRAIEEQRIYDRWINAVPLSQLVCHRCNYAYWGGKKEFEWSGNWVMGTVLCPRATKINSADPDRCRGKIWELLGFSDYEWKKWIKIHVWGRAPSSLCPHAIKHYEKFYKPRKISPYRKTPPRLSMDVCGSCIGWCKADNVLLRKYGKVRCPQVADQKLLSVWNLPPRGCSYMMEQMVATDGYLKRKAAKAKRGELQISDDIRV